MTCRDRRCGNGGGEWGNDAAITISVCVSSMDLLLSFSLEMNESGDDEEGCGFFGASNTKTYEYVHPSRCNIFTF
jgi:hypothetical protein